MNYFQNASLYVGNDADNATNNTLCKGSPFLNVDDSKNYSTDTLDNVNERVWNYGDEAWCNLKGRYLHLVANLDH